MSVDILVCNYNTKHLIAPMLDAIKASVAAPEVRVLLIDNASTDGSAAYIRTNHPDLPLIENQSNVGFGRANNQLVPLIESEYVLLLNTDAFVSPHCLGATYDFMENTPECGILGVKLTSSDGSLQPSCRYFPTPLNLFLAKTGLHRFLPWVQAVDNMTWPHNEVKACDWVPGCYYLVRKRVIEEIGLFDPRFFLYYEEVDHCKRAKKAGWGVYFYPHAETVHIGGESAKSAGNINNSGRQISALQIESEVLYLRKHHGLFGLAFHLALTWLHVQLKRLKGLAKGTMSNSAAHHEHVQLMALRHALRSTVWGRHPTR